MSIKFLVFWGWVLGFWGGGGADFIFMGVRIFLNRRDPYLENPALLLQDAPFSFHYPGLWPLCLGWCPSTVRPVFPVWSFNWASDRTVLGQAPQPYSQAVSNRRFVNSRFSQLNDERCWHVRERSPSKCCGLPVSEALLFVGKSAERAVTSGWQARTCQHLSSFNCENRLLTNRLLDTA